MKQLTVILLLVLIPLILISSVRDFQSLYNSLNLNNMQYLNRNWRLNDVMAEYYASDWEIESKSEYVYNLTYPTRLDTINAYSWNNVEYVLSMKIAYTYDQTGQYCTQIVYSNVLGSVVEPYCRTSIQLDAQNRVSMVIWENYDYGTMGWTLGCWEMIFYNTNSINYLIDYYPAYSENPPFWDKTTYTNDGQGRPIISTTQTSTDSLNWVNTQNTEIIYSPNDTTTGNDFIASFGHMEVGFHALSHGLFYTAAMVSEQTRQYYDNGWQNDTRWNYTYDAQNRLIQRDDRYWDNGWQDLVQTIYDYNTDGNLYQAIEYFWEGTAWGNSYRITCAWGQDTSNDDSVIPVTNGLSVGIAPNPFAGQISIRTQSKSDEPVSISIYNTRGQLVRNMSSRTNNTVCWDGKDSNKDTVPVGIYFIRAVSSGQSSVIKTIKIQ
jgi:hypothetical protein